MYKKILIFLFSIILVLSSIIISYKVIKDNYDYTSSQEKVVKYLDGEIDELSGFNNRELIHLKDVRQVMSSVNNLLILLLVLSLTTGLILYWQDQLGTGFIVTGAVGYSMIILLIVFSLIDFNYLFNLFHKLFFEPGSWVFPSDSKLITLFPLNFFKKILKEIIILFITISSLLLLAGYDIKFFEEK